MTEHPILFSAPMIRAILGGRKTQTRRIIKSPNEHCRYGNVGERLWVRETWGKHRDFEHSSPIGMGLVGYRADERTGCPHSLINRWRPSIHMPRCLSRISLAITDVRIQRLQEITEEDAKAEGCAPFRAWAHGEANCRDGFIVLWNSINSKRGYGWQNNPEVWAISFNVIKPSLEYENESKKSQE